MSYTTLPPQQADWQSFIDVFLAKNAQLNLSAIRDAEGVFVKHICDALEWVNAFPFPEGVSVIDVWTGGWVPLLPLATYYPHIQFTGLDSVRKKVAAVQEMADTLGLQNVKTVRARAEDHKQQYDILTARAMSSAENLFARCFHLVKKGGYFMLYKMYTEDEDDMLYSLAGGKGLTFVQEYFYTLYEWDIQRVIYVFQK